MHTRRQKVLFARSTQLNTRLEAHKCGLGSLTREALGTIGSGPNTDGTHEQRDRLRRKTCMSYRNRSYAYIMSIADKQAKVLKQ